MGKKKDKRAAANSRSFKKEEDEIIDSPFKNIVLKEKKEEPKAKKPQSEKKKPSEIVQGYDPGASFADILSNWEKTGNPYALPHEKRKEKAETGKKESFGDILSSWDRMNDPESQRKKKEVKRVSPEYKPTKDFGALLDQYEGKAPRKVSEAPVRRKEKDSVPVATFFRDMEEDDERPSSVTWSVFGSNDVKKPLAEEKKETQSPKKEKRSSKQYKPTKDFGSLLDEFEGRKPEAIKPQTIEEEKKPEEPEVKKPTFFREKEADDERPSGVAWSVFGDNKPIERPRAEEKKPEEKKPAEKQVERASEEYKPTKDFGSLLDEFEGRKPEAVKTQPSEEVEKPVEPEVKKPTFFREKEADDERPSGVAWSVFGDNKPIERPRGEEKKPEEKKPAEKQMERASEEYKPTKDFGALLNEFEGRKTQKEAVEKPSEEKKSEEADVKKATFFREKEEDDERPSSVAWSVFGDNKPIERPKAEEKKPEKSVEEKKPAPVQKVPVRKSRLFSESVKKMPEKTFDEIIREKGELKRKQREKTLNELRIMLPMATLDLHGMGYTEAEGEVNRFLDEALSSRIEKVAIIHGKGLHSSDGEGVLKELVYTILERRAVAREITVPKAQYGGSGAVWVILKKEAEEPS